MIYHPLVYLFSDSSKDVNQRQRSGNHMMVAAEAPAVW